ncbi:hypothetical protein [Bradyrhizobium sp. CCBAU 45394]|uniref:hypothetical protein n=1 Tax=Bradyrhizobium sp. CCBAU 45394 TaxID=1325087 RepID=UPI002FE2ECED
MGKGAGAHVVQQINGSIARPAGIILWESKGTKAWSNGWLGRRASRRLPSICSTSQQMPRVGCLPLKAGVSRKINCLLDEERQVRDRTT